MNNPFENTDARFQVLKNDQGEHSLWPVTIKTPEGWLVVMSENSREACLEYINTHWTDMRPKSLVEAMTKPS